MTVRWNWRAARRAALIVLAAIAAGCAKPVVPPPPPAPPPPPPPSVIEISLAVAADVNPDARERASPLVARLFELKTLAAFDGADFFALTEHDKDTLGPDLVAKEELLLQPGEQRTFKRTLDPATRFVAVVAAYRDIERARWRATMPVALNQTMPVTLSVQQREIALAPAAAAAP
jgi:type VI secretion system protein VasD